MLAESPSFAAPQELLAKFNSPNALLRASRASKDIARELRSQDSSTRLHRRVIFDQASGELSLIIYFMTFDRHITPYKERFIATLVKSGERISIVSSGGIMVDVADLKGGKDMFSLLSEARVKSQPVPTPDPDQDLYEIEEAVRLSNGRIVITNSLK